MPSADQRFDEKWMPEPNTGCWLWTAYVAPDGYGRINIAKVPVLAHRFAYERWVGPIPEGLTIDHLCRVRNCVNPFHLEAVTIGENVLRGTGPTALNAKKTHCHNGHPLEGAYLRRNGGRNCRTCMNEARKIARREAKARG